MYFYVLDIKKLMIWHRNCTSENGGWKMKEIKFLGDLPSGNLPDPETLSKPPGCDDRCSDSCHYACEAFPGLTASTLILWAKGIGGPI